MPDEATSVDLDAPMSNVDVADENISGAVFTGEGAETAEGAEAAEQADHGFEVVEGFQPPAPPRETTAVLESAEALLTGPDESAQLRDIGEASFGPPGAVLETVHGRDDRIRIRNTNPYPWRAHASLRITAADNSLWIGTGWFVGPKLLVTAGHVVYIKNSGVPGRDGWVKKMTVMPGRDQNRLPYGSTTSTSFWTVAGWANNGDDEYDYGAIVLTEPLGNRTGWFGFGNWPDLSNVSGNISGYPGDKPSGTQWYAGRRIDSTTPRKVFYDIDTAGGQSGSAVYRFWSGGRYGMAIHAYGGATVNSGTRINRAVFNNIRDWKEASEA
jgi:glutamyl endopeptidase